jgi:hypothetical protein
MSFLSAFIRKVDGSVNRFPLYGKDSLRLLPLTTHFLTVEEARQFRNSVQGFVVALKHDESDERGHCSLFLIT